MNLPDPGIEYGSPALQADSLSSDPPGKTFTTFISRGGANSEGGDLDSSQICLVGWDARFLKAKR